MQSEEPRAEDRQNNEQIHQTGRSFTNLQRCLIVDGIIAHAPCTDDRFRAPAHYAQERANKTDHGIAILVVRDRDRTHDEDATKRNEKRDELLQLHLLFQEQHCHERTERRIERRDHSRIGRTDIVDRDHIAAHADRATEQCAQHDHLTAACLERRNRVLQTAAHSHIDEHPDRAEHIMERCTRDRGERDSLYRVDEGSHRKRNG